MWKVKRILWLGVLILCLSALSGCDMIKKMDVIEAEAAETTRLKELDLVSDEEEVELEDLGDLGELEEWNSNYGYASDLLKSKEKFANSDNGEEIKLYSITHSLVKDEVQTYVNYNNGSIALDSEGDVLYTVKYPKFNGIGQMKEDGIIIQKFYQSGWFKTEGFEDEDIKDYFDLRYGNVDKIERDKLVEDILSESEIEINGKEGDELTDLELQKMMELLNIWSMERVLDSEYWFDGEKEEWKLYE